MSKAASLDLDITQGEDISLDITMDLDGVPIDITGWVFTGQIRASAASTTALANFNFSVTDAAAGALTVSLSDTATALLPAGRLAYDWWVNYGDDIDAPLVAGTVKCYARVTR